MGDSLRSEEVLVCTRCWIGGIRHGSIMHVDRTCVRVIRYLAARRVGVGKAPARPSAATERDDGLVHYDAPEQLAFGSHEGGGTWWSCLGCGHGGVGSNPDSAGQLAMNHVLGEHPEPSGH